ncbi:Extracellular matrix-binding ebh, putative [Babesia ovata]|uniref:Extracellular matrix-binding ebh, putative n=1 Tax=Babesia ovata TaxID=189622 RepID=A0A2H6KKK5_9APIC|nr:Extracellular matrix-binding ebh, putative [Babesia ovata]GBE63512.1 Extracellular matrix-binding ebh, putative [Babesia ovata]
MKFIISLSVHDALVIDSGSGQLKREIDQISSSNEAINEANKTLASEVDNLGKWNAAAREVIHKANEKCEEILKKVKTDKGSPGPIYENAKTLNEKAQTLLKAAKDAKQAVELNVTEALQAVVAMDNTLKMDLFNVKRQVQLGIGNVIDSLGVLKLDEEVMKDLGELKGNIEGLGNKTDDIVSGQLTQLQSAKEEFNKNAVEKIKTAEQGLEKNFNEHIQKPISDKVQEVESAIGTLGGKFADLGTEEQKKLEKIFEHIHKKVGEIVSGKNGRGMKTGLSAVVEKVRGLAGLFKGPSQFEHKVQGWVENNILKVDPIKTFIEQYVGDNGKEKFHGNYGMKKNNDAVYTDLNNQIAIVIKQQLTSEAGAAGDVVKSQFDAVDSHSNEKIKGYVTALKEGCNTFVKEFESRLKADKIDQFPDTIDTLVDAVVQKITSAVKNGSPAPDTKYLIPAVQGAVIQLLVVARQVAVELGSFALNADNNHLSLADNVDNALKVATELDRQLTAATQIPKPGGPNESPAQAVDSKLQAVRSDVDTGIASRFKSDVTKDLQEAVDKLPEAVEQFNTEAQTQIKEAATTAIDKAAEQISKTGQIKFSDDFMKEFNTQFTKITHPTTGLKSEIEKKVDEHIGQDDPASGPAEKVKIIDTNFTNYNGHVKQEKSKNVTVDNLENLQGQLPLAIGKISDEGLKPFGENGVKDTLNAGATTFTVPFGIIKTELGEIKKLVENKPVGGNFIDGYKDDQKGVKTLLYDLKEWLSDKNGHAIWYGFPKGLQQIEKAIDRMQTGTFQNQPAAIDLAVKAIRQELKTLRTTLKTENGKKDEDVIERLKHMKDEGLGDQNDWTPNGQPLSGLGKIESELQEQNKQLGEQTKIIGDNMTILVRKIKLELAKIGYKLENLNTDDDVMDNLKKLKEKIGQGKAENGNLQEIQKAIKSLHYDPFNTHPTTIGKANSAIKTELTTLQNVLQGKPGDDVLATLNDLQNNGLNNGDWDTQKDAKGLQTIENDLKGQQTTLSSQPTEIQTGVQSITQSLNRLQKQLNTEVTKKLDDLKNHGLEKGDTKWNEGNNINGPVKIKN